MLGFVRDCDDSFGKKFSGLAAGEFDRSTFLEISEPGVLSFGKLPGACLDLGEAVVETRLVVKAIDDFFVAKRLTGGVADGAGSIEKFLNLGH